MALARLRLRILKEKALCRGVVVVIAFEDRKTVRARLVADHAGNAGGEIRAVRLEGAGAQSILPRFARRQEIINRVGLIAVRHDRGIVEHTHRVVDDKGRILHLALVKRTGSQIVAHWLKNAVAAVFAAPHDKIRDNGLFPILAAANQDAAARVACRGDLRLHILSLHTLFTPPCNAPRRFPPKACPRRTEQPPSEAASIPLLPSHAFAASRGYPHPAPPQRAGE